MEIKIPDTTDIGAELKRLDHQAIPIADGINTVEQYAASGDSLLAIAALREQINITFNPLIKLGTELLDSIRLTKSSFSFPLDTLRLQIERHRSAFEAAEEARKLLLGSMSPELMEDMGLDVPQFSNPPELPLPKTKGVYSRNTYRAEITDIKALCRAVAEGKAPEEYVMGNMPVLNKIANTSKTLMTVPGVKAVKNTSTVARKPKKVPEL